MSSLQQPRLVLGKNLSLDPYPQTRPTQSSKRILIVGGGVTGLVTAWVLLDRGYKVTVLSKEWASFGEQQRLTSQIAGALWEYPPAVCGHHTDAISLENSKRWCMVAYHIWAAIAADPAHGTVSGVQMRDSNFFFPCKIEDDRAQYEKMKQIEASGVRKFCRNRDVIRELNINPSYGAVDSYRHLAPIIDTDQCMKWLMTLVRSKGCNFVTQTIEGDLFDQEDTLRARFHADAIVNATGLAASSLAGDSTCYPIRGALIRVVNDGVAFEKVTSALTITAKATRDGNEMVFIVPRSDNTLLIGGIAQPRVGELDLTLDSPIIQRMRSRCEEFLPRLKHAHIDSVYPLAQGLRPFRKQNVRVERELRTRAERQGGRKPSRIVHSYGQGGSGWTLSFGCAEDVVPLIEEALAGLPASPMADTGTTCVSSKL